MPLGRMRGAGLETVREYQRDELGVKSGAPSFHSCQGPWEDLAVATRLPLFHTSTGSAARLGRREVEWEGEEEGGGRGRGGGAVGGGYAVGGIAYEEEQPRAVGCAGDLWVRCANTGTAICRVAGSKGP